MKTANSDSSNVRPGLEAPSAPDGLAWFRSARFGLFLHYGLYSVMGRNEWAMFLDRLSLPEYCEFANRFNPTHYDPAAWAAAAVEAGAKYLVLTTRHHDGFSLFDTKTDDFNSVKTAAKRDLVGSFVEATRAAGLKVGLYYSLADWRYKGYWQPREFPESAARMAQQAHEQVRELLTHYGTIDMLWYDGGGAPEGMTPAAYWRADELRDMARRLQPSLIINDRSGIAGDFDTPECTIRPSADPGRPWESCLQMDAISWGHVPYSALLKPAEQIVCDLVQIASGGGNLLLNTGPMPDGRLRPEEESRIRAVGPWLRRNVEAIYGSTRSPLNGGPMGSPNRHAYWIGSADPRVHYLATLCWTGPEFMTVLVNGDVRRASLLSTGQEVGIRRGSMGRMVFTGLPVSPPDSPVTVIKVEFDQAPSQLSVPSDGAWLGELGRY